MLQETTSTAGEVVKATPPAAISWLDHVGFYIDPAMKLATLIYTLLMTINLIRKWRRR